MSTEVIQPSISKTGFCCPHCGILASQSWLNLYAQFCDRENPNPVIPGSEEKNEIISDSEFSVEQKKDYIEWVDKMSKGLVFLERKSQSGLRLGVNNLFLCRCYNCGEISVWLHDKLIFPNVKQGSRPNQDLPDEIIHDIEEARSIVNLSPRGAAALLRLVLQKLCIHLGEKGKRIDDDIANLVAKGLNPLIQKSLDIVRVVGNEAVHPGVIDLKDDRDTAIELFDLINSIADQMITHPKNVKELYEKLPESKRKAINERDKKAKSKIGK